jgi:hypothetical protein
MKKRFIIVNGPKTLAYQGMKDELLLVIPGDLAPEFLTDVMKPVIADRTAAEALAKKFGGTIKELI